MTTDSISECMAINEAMIAQSLKMVRDGKDWENESDNAKKNYAAGYAAALEFANHNMKRAIAGDELHHLEQQEGRIMSEAEERDWQAFDDNTYWMNDEQASQAAADIRSKYVK